MRVHGRGQRKLGWAGREKGCGDEVVGDPSSGLCHDVGSARANEHQVSPLGEHDVRNRRVDEPIEARRDLVTAQGLEGRLSHELKRVLRHCHTDVVTRLLQETEDLARLVGGHAARDTEKDPRLAVGFVFTAHDAGPPCRI